MWSFNDYRGLPKYQNINKFLTTKNIKERLSKNFASTFSKKKCGLDHVRMKEERKFKRTEIDTSNPKVLNPIDYKFLKAGS